MFDKRLLRIINQGRCFVLVGSGPSCEVGYPSWKKLAELTYSELKKKNYVKDPQSYENYLLERKYPEFFRQAERDLGDDRIKLIELIKGLLITTNRNQGVLYDLISKWPFACYLTTNYDDEISFHLEKLGEHFTTIHNRKDDFACFRDGVNHVIQKLHSDLNHPQDAILTSADYSRLYAEDAGKYFRDKLSHIFTFFDVFIIGHSIYDPDINYVLRLAKDSASPQHPIYMIAADFTKANEQEYLERFNIVLVKYDNRDGLHSELRRILKTASRFITPRHQLKERTPLQARSEEETESAVALFMFRRLQGIQSKDYISSLLLSGLYSLDNAGILIDEIASLPTLKNFTTTGSNYEEAIKDALTLLDKQNLISHAANRISINDNGRTKVNEYKITRQIEKDQAYGQFRLNLQINCPSIKTEQLDQCQKSAEEVIVTSFANRGLTIANQIYSGMSASPGELSDVFGYVADKASEIQDPLIRTSFIEELHQFLVEPNEPQRNYLASISQG